MELDYDDCDIAVVEKSAEEDASIDDQIREIGFKGLKSVPRDSGEEDEEEEADQASQLTSGEGSQSPADPTSGEEGSREGGGGGGAGDAESLTPAMEEFSSAYQTVMRLLENGERISAMYRCARIQGTNGFKPFY